MVRAFRTWTTHYETVVYYFIGAMQFLPRVLFDHNIGYGGLSFANNARSNIIKPRAHNASCINGEEGENGAKAMVRGS